MPNDREVSGDAGRRMPGWWALSPLAVFLCFYLVLSLIAGDFYKVPIAVAFVFAAVWGIVITRGIPLPARLERFSAGAANKNILMMVWIFVLAGAFAHAAKSMGAIDAAVNLTLHVLPANLLLAGVFVAACFISLSIGTSVGTIVALVPVAMGLAGSAGIDPSFMTAIVVGGAFFGDNLSFISDTTIAATRTQGCYMRDKFRANLLIVAPAAVLVALFYVAEGFTVSIPPGSYPVEWVRILPYLVVLATAVAGMNVMAVLILGIVLTGAVGMFTGSFGFFGWVGALGEGIKGMGELIVITLLAGGLLELIRYNGGIDYIIGRILRHVKNKPGAELSIALLVSLSNLCTANNTIAIITVGPIAREISRKYGVNPAKSASLLDTFSCMVQGLIPYGAQLLMASGLAGLSPVGIIRYLYYPAALGVVALAAIFLRRPRRYS